jgi:hypothetical protein
MAGNHCRVKVKLMCHLSDSLTWVSLHWNSQLGHAIARVVSHWLPSTTAQVWAHVRLCGICGGQSDTGVGFHQVVWFLLPILISLTDPHSSLSIIWGWYSRPVSGQCTKWTQSHPTPRNGGGGKTLNWSLSTTRRFPNPHLLQDSDHHYETSWTKVELYAC